MATTTQEFKGSFQYPVRTLSVKANTGSIKIQLKVGANWIDSGDTFSADGAHAVQQGLADVKIVVTGDAEYEYI